jgi:hypothetical protein
MTIPEIINTLKENHCGKCAVAAAIAALEKICSEPLQITACPPAAAKKPAKALKLKPVAGDPKTRTEKACKKCGVVKPLSEYPKNHTCADGHTGECKKCCRNRSRASWRKRHGKPEVSPNADSEATVTCKLCNAVCRNQAKYKSHMRTVHDMVEA